MKKQLELEFTTEKREKVPLRTPVPINLKFKTSIKNKASLKPLKSAIIPPLMDTP